MNDNDQTLDWIKEKFRNQHPLTLAEEKVLFRLIRKGNLCAKRKVICANMKFVIQVARNFYCDSLSREDLVNEGAIGLWRAVESFDYTRGVKFITYAVWWIKAFIARAISEKGSLVRLPLNQQIKLHKAIRNCNDKKVLDEEIQKLDSISGRQLSLSTSLDYDGNIRLNDILVDEHVDPVDKNVAQEMNRKFSNRLLNKLPSREKEILSKIFGLNEVCKNIRDISTSMKLSRERIRQLRDQAMARIRGINSDGHLTQTLQELGCA